MPSTLTLIRIALYTALIVLYGSPAYSSPDPDLLITTRHLFKRSLFGYPWFGLKKGSIMASLSKAKLFGKPSTPKPKPGVRSQYYGWQTAALKTGPDTSDSRLEELFRESWTQGDLSVKDMLGDLRKAGLEDKGQVSPLQFAARQSKDAVSRNALKLDEKGKKRWDWIARYAKKYTDTPDEVSEGKWEGFDREKDFMMGFLGSSDLQIFRRNINYMLSKAWKPEEFENPLGSPKWVIKRYVKQWKAKGLDVEKMTKLGTALGISKDGVRPFSAQEFDNLNRKQPAYNTFDEWEADKKKMISWYQNANMASLSSKDQAILDFNLAYVYNKPWWRETEMGFWGNSRMPYEVLAEVGTLLKLGSEKVIEESNPKAVREAIWTILVDFASKVDIEEPLEAFENVMQGQILKQLSLTSQLGRFKEEILKNNLNAVTLQDHPIWTTIKLETLDEKEEEVIARLIQVDLLLNGVHPSRAREFGKALSDDRSNSLIGLITGGERARLDMVQVLPEGFGGRLDRKIVYPALKKWFETRLKIEKNRFRVLLWKYFFAFHLSRALKNLRRFGIMIRRA
ncbi:hypothetical protein CROQUDRAFT_688237 [Cronartium quercuum f. sp. fusiforme G11]|uniref:Uncharacterized protein n=1 Tax=Cronartium quercuum f. sp. fusiforme G11 TaxID=708437 RepID=A0A9P6N6W4_9BASI|nr:hypothetical protein CROQUDRAFT_688237 [Cronartium quercuum f. sp. fusiforme G11]